MIKIISLKIIFYLFLFTNRILLYQNEFATARLNNPDNEYRIDSNHQCPYYQHHSIHSSCHRKFRDIHFEPMTLKFLWMVFTDVRIVDFITYWNIHKSHQRLIHPGTQPRSRTDSQLITMTLFQVICSSIFLNIRTAYFHSIHQFNQGYLPSCCRNHGLTNLQASSSISPTSATDLSSKNSINSSNSNNPSATKAYCERHLQSPYEDNHFCLSSGLKKKKYLKDVLRACISHY